jgi:CheY-like chemotaxis protein
MSEAPILLVEDDPSHALLVRRVLERARLANPVLALQRGDDAFDYLAGEGAYTDRQAHPMPVLLLLDLHVPGRDGLDILAWIRKEPELGDLPVVMFSGSGDAEDINRAFELGADSYLVKPVAFDALLDTIHGLGLRWSIVRTERER